MSATTNLTAELVVQAVRTSVENILTIHADGHAFADHEDIVSAIVTGVALAFAGLVVTEDQSA